MALEIVVPDKTKKRIVGFDLSGCNSESKSIVIEQVLIRTAVKDTVRCMIICKSWGRFIGDPGFRRAYERTSGILITQDKSKIFSFFKNIFECRCGKGDVVLRTSCKLESYGRQYYACPCSKSRIQDNGCGYFMWKDVTTVNSGRMAARSPLVHIDFETEPTKDSSQPLNNTPSPNSVLPQEPQPVGNLKGVGITQEDYLLMLARDVNNLAGNLNQQGAYQSHMYNEFMRANRGWSERVNDVATYVWLCVQRMLKYVCLPRYLVHMMPRYGDVLAQFHQLPAYSVWVRQTRHAHTE